MAVFNRILVPVDGSATSDKALDYAVRLAREGRAALRVLHAIDELAYTGGFEYAGDVALATRGAAQRLLDQAADTVKRAGFTADTQLVEQAGRRLGEAVAEAARDWQADLVVAGTHGRKGLARALLGSGAEQIVRSCPVPVLVVRGDEAA